jgi:hypothetical protein
MKNNNVYRLGSLTFGTVVMKTEECILFLKCAKAEGHDPETALEDMKMIDDTLHMKQLYRVAHGSIKLTSSGHLRKGTTLYDSIMSVVIVGVEVMISNKINTEL